MRRTDQSASRTFDAMGTLLLADRNPARQHPFAQQWFDRELDYVFGLDEAAFWDFLQQAQDQRVLRRIAEVLKGQLPRAKRRHFAEHIHFVLSQEQKRVETFFFTFTAITEIYTLPLHAALPAQLC